jgi:glucose-6-phosphate-specific signal transduction histidine kinase
MLSSAKASSVAMTLTVAGDSLLLSVRDDRNGWDEGRNSRGLSNMRKRAGDVGKLTCPHPGAARVTWKVPYP